MNSTASGILRVWSAMGLVLFGALGTPGACAESFDPTTTASVWSSVSQEAPGADAVGLPDEALASDYAAIQHAFLRERYDTVARLAEPFLQRFSGASERSRVWMWLSMSFVQLERWRDALRVLDRMKDQLTHDDPIWPEVLFWEGDISRRLSQTLRAKLAWSRLLEQYPKSKWASPEVQLGMGRVYLSQQAFRTALAYVRGVRRSAPQSALAMEARLLEGLCLLRLERFEGAIATFRPLLTHLKDSDELAQAAFHLAEAFSGLGRHEEAVQAYERALASRPDSLWGGPARFGLGWAQFHLGRCEESVATLARVLEAARVVHETDALFAQGSCLVQLGDDTQALERLGRVRRRGPAHPLAFESGLLIAEIHRRAGYIPQASALLERLLKQAREAPSRLSVHLRLGAVRLDQGDAVSAQHHFDVARQAADLETKQAALNGLGDVQIYLGEPHKARRHYEEVRTLSERGAGSAYAMYQLGRLQLLLGEPAEAIRIFQQLTVQDSSRLAEDARLALALAYLQINDERQARSQLDTLRRTHPGRPAASRAAYYLAILALANGREERVRRFCEEVITGAPRSDEAVEATILLAEMDAGRMLLGQAVARLRAAFDAPTILGRHQGLLAKKLGDMSRLLQQYAQAIHWYELSGRLTPSLGGEVGYRVASCYEEAGDIELAIARYHRIPDPAWMVRGQLAAAKLLQRQERWDEAGAVYESLAHQSIPEARVAREQLALLRADPSVSMTGLLSTAEHSLSMASE